VTFAARMHQVVGGAFAPLGTMIVQLESANEVGTTAVGTLSFNSNGTISLTETYEYQVVTLPTNWFTPTVANIGSSYEIRFTLLSGAAWDSGLVSGTLYPLSSNRSIAWTRSYDVNSNPETASVLIEILIAGGGPAYKSGTLSVEVFNGEA
jgi:hypothetical protein